MESFELIPGRNARYRPSRVGPQTLIGGRYRVRGPLGVGGMTWVWEADRDDGPPVAVKILKDSLLAEGAGELLHREADLLHRIDDRSVPRVLDVGEHRGLPFLVCTLIRGRTVEEVLQDGPLPSWRRGAEFALELARVLGEAHRRAVLHRDLNARNVMARSCPRSGRLEPVLIDFGLGHSLAGPDTSLCHRLAGNTRTLAPEQIRHRALGADPRTDVYQFGLLLYRLLTGREAFAGPGADPLVERILAGNLPRPRAVRPGIDPAVEGVCVRAMAVDGRRRPADAQHLHAELRRALGSGAGPRAWLRRWRSGRGHSNPPALELAP